MSNAPSAEFFKSYVNSYLHSNMALDPWPTQFANSYCYTPAVNFGRGIAHGHDETLLHLLSLHIATT